MTSSDMFHVAIISNPATQPTFAQGMVCTAALYWCGVPRIGVITAVMPMPEKAHKESTDLPCGWHIHGLTRDVLTTFVHDQSCHYAARNVNSRIWESSCRLQCTIHGQESQQKLKTAHGCRAWNSQCMGT